MYHVNSTIHRIVTFIIGILGFFLFLIFYLNILNVIYQNYFQVPPTIRFVLDGEMPPYLLAKDLILQVRLQNTCIFFCTYLFTSIF